MNFATLQGLTIPDGVVTKIECGGVVLWELDTKEYIFNGVVDLTEDGCDIQWNIEPVYDHYYTIEFNGVKYEHCQYVYTKASGFWQPGSDFGEAPHARFMEPIWPLLDIGWWEDDTAPYIYINRDDEVSRGIYTLKIYAE